MITICTHDKEPNVAFDLAYHELVNIGKSNRVIVGTLQDQKKYVFKVFPNNENSLPFIQERMIHSSISHPNIIQYISSLDLPFENTTYPAIIMQYAPYGDFFDLFLDYDLKDEKLVRTFFHHLIEGLEYLHSCNIAHLDLKLENLLLGEDFLLKIADFDLARKVGFETSCLNLRGGTANYRSPEIISGTCINYYAADIYAAGICLYTLMTGAFPFSEEHERQSVNLFRYNTFFHGNDEFWSENEALIAADGKRGRYFSESFRELLNRMWALNPSKRITIEDIKKSVWYNEPVYSKEELKNILERAVKMPNK